MDTALIIYVVVACAVIVAAWLAGTLIWAAVWVVGYIQYRANIRRLVTRARQRRLTPPTGPPARR